MNRLFLALVVLSALFVIATPAYAQWGWYGQRGPHYAPSVMYRAPAYGYGYVPQPTYVQPPPVYGPTPFPMAYGGYMPSYATPAYLPVPTYVLPPAYAAPPRPMDTDNDSVPDVLDRCPSMSGPSSVDPAMNGCPPIPRSTFRVESDVTICRALNGHEVCGWVGTLDATRQPINEHLLMQIATVKRWGQGWAVVVRFTRHANGLVDANVTATPIDPRYNFDSVRGTGPSTIEAMQNALDSVQPNRQTTEVIR